jgi:hypothetical protein
VNPVTKSDFEKRVGQLRTQIEDVRDNLDELLKSYNRLMEGGAVLVTQAQKPVASAARQARQDVENVAGNISEANIPWWVPVAVVGVIGAGVWLYNTLTSTANVGPTLGRNEQSRGQSPTGYGNYTAGSPPTTPPSEAPYTEPR